MIQWILWTEKDLRQVRRGQDKEVGCRRVVEGSEEQAIRELAN